MNYTTPFTADLTTESRAELNEFESSFPCKNFLHIFESAFHFESFDIAIVRSLMERTGEKNTMIAAKHFGQAIQYNISHRKKIRGLIAYKKLIGKNNLTTKNKEMVHLLGWCIEMVSLNDSKLNLI